MRGKWFHNGGAMYSDFRHWDYLMNRDSGHRPLIDLIEVGNRAATWIEGCNACAARYGQTHRYTCRFFKEQRTVVPGTV